MKGSSSAIYLMILATLSLSLMHAGVKALEQMNTFEIFFIRGVITSLMCLCYLFFYNIPVLARKQKWVIFRGVTGVISTCIFYFTLKWMPFGAAVSLKYLSPIFAAALAIFIVHEKLRPVQWVFFSIAFLGVMMLKGFDSRVEMIPLILALVASVIGGLAFIFIRKIGSSEHAMVIVLYYMLISAASMGLLAIPYWSKPLYWEWIVLLLLSIAGFLGQLWMTRAMQMEAVSRVVPLKYLELVYALLIGLFWFGEGYSFLSFLGILLIMIGVILNMIFGSATRKTIYRVK